MWGEWNASPSSIWPAFDSTAQLKLTVSQLELQVLNFKLRQRETSMNSKYDLRPTHPMNRRAFVSMVAAGAASTLLQGTAAVAAPAPKARNVVLVHGLFADGSSWSEVIARLQAAGLNVTSVQNPLTTLPEAVAPAERVLSRQDGPTVLVGHSFSGMIVTEAGMHPNVSALVYVAARAPDAGEDYTALAKTYPAPPASAGIVFDGDEGHLSEAAFLHDFAGDLPEAKAKVLYAVQEPFQKALLAGKTTHAAWRSKPSFCAVSTEDRTINPDLERFMAKRMNAKTIEVKASHLSLISRPDEITRLILEAAGQPA
jgi:pimeloyl-ACP methyl ester carboxylesterase